MRSTEFPMVSGLEELPAPSAAVRSFFEAWKAARQGNLVPRKQDFDPLLVFPQLPNLWIYHYDRDEDVFRCRLAGERINAAWGHPIAGKTSQEILGARDNPFVTAIWKKILDTPLIHYGKLERLTGNVLYAAERMVTPLSNAAGSRDYILGISVYSLGGLRKVTPPTVPKTAYHIDCRNL